MSAVCCVTYILQWREADPSPDIGTPDVSWVTSTFLHQLMIDRTETLANVYASADQQAITAYFSHKAVERALGSGLDPARDALQAKLIEIMQTYRKELAGGGSSGLQLPQNLRALPVLFLGLIKNVRAVPILFL